MEKHRLWYLLELTLNYPQISSSSISLVTPRLFLWIIRIITAILFVGKEWDKIIPKADIDKAEEEDRQRELLQLNLPPRIRTTIQQLERNYDSDAKKGEDEEESSSSDSDEDRPKKRGRPRAGKQDNIRGFTNAEIRRFIKSFKKFGSPLTRYVQVSSWNMIEPKQCTIWASSQENISLGFPTR